MEVKKIVEGMTAPEVAQVIDDNFKAQNKILEEDIATQNSVIGVSEYKEFSEAEAVNAGDVRKYNGLLYECVEATEGAWDESKWKKSSFKAETEKKLSELGSEARKIFTEKDLEFGFYYTSENGSVLKKNSDVWGCLKVSTFGVFNINLTTNGISNAPSVLFADENGLVIETYIQSGNIEVPSESKYAYINCKHDEVDFYVKLNDSISIVKNNTESLISKEKILGEDYISKGFWYKNNGIGSVVTKESTPSMWGVLRIETFGAIAIKVSANLILSNTAPCLMFADKDLKLIDFVNNPLGQTFEIPSNAVYALINHNYGSEEVFAVTLLDYKENIQKNENEIKILSENVKSLEDNAGYDISKKYGMTIGGYIDYTTGEYNSGSQIQNTLLTCSDYIYIAEVSAITVYAKGSSKQSWKTGFAFYDSNKVFISGGKIGSSLGYYNIEIPLNAAYFRASTIYSVGEENTSFVKTETYRNRRITISCYGDSVTEGVWLNGQGTSEYGADPYPAQIYTMLKDEGISVKVNNYGHGSEKMNDVLARMVAIPSVFNADISIKGKTSIGTCTYVNNMPTETKIDSLSKDENGNRYNLYFTRDNGMNPFVVNGEKYTFSVDDSSKTMYLDGNGEIKIGDIAFPSCDKNSDVNIIFCGYNDGSANLTLDRFIDGMKKAALVNGGKYIIVGSTHNFISATHEEITNRCLDEFGAHFLDLYYDFFRFGEEILTGNGMMPTMNEGELQTWRDLMSSHIIPSNLTGNNQQGNVHPNRAGYSIIATLIIRKLKGLSYITEVR